MLHVIIPELAAIGRILKHAECAADEPTQSLRQIFVCTYNFLSAVYFIDTPVATDSRCPVCRMQYLLQSGFTIRHEANNYSNLH